MRIFHGDCVKMLQEHFPEESVDCIVTSPPYDGIRQYQQGAEFDLCALGVQVQRVLREGCFAIIVIADQKKNKRLSLTTARLMIDWVDNAGLSLCDWLIYHRPGRIGRFHSFRRDHESILVFFKGAAPRDINTDALKKKVNNSRPGSVHNVSVRNLDDSMTVQKIVTKSDRMCRGSVWYYPKWGNLLPRIWHTTHPAMMKDDLACDLVKGFSSPGELVLDPFCGSGTTGVAAIKQGRHFAGIDISKEYCDLSMKRIKEETKQSDLLVQGML